MYSKATYKDEFLKITQSITDITYMANLIRITKTPHEVEYIKKAAIIADKAMDTAINTIKSGVKVSTVASKIVSVQAEHGTFTSIAPMIMVDELAAHMNWCSETLKPNNMVRVEIAGAYNHYHCPIARTIFVGDKEDLENSKYAGIYKLENALKEGMDEILKVLKIGAISGDIYDIFNKTIGKYNLFKESRIGYSFGLGFPPDWGENTISVRHGDTTVIQENMCLHFILGCGDEWGYEYSEALIVTKNGPELLCKTPRMLFLRK
uniref:M24 Family Metallopeptidase n=1 Tax=Florenciella sp. virus SA2 TaxID=3240092 RepID=A0AB39JBA1_9VIRU